MADYSTWAWVGGSSTGIDATLEGSLVSPSLYNSSVVLNDANNDGTIGDLDGGASPTAGEGITVDGVFHQIAQMTSWTVTITMDDSQPFVLGAHVYRLDDNTLYYRISDASVDALTANGYHAGNITTIELTTFGSNFENMAPTNFDAAFPLCFCADANIMTINGEVPIAKLSAGNLVATKDEGFCRVKCAVKSTFTAEEVALSDNLRPVVIPANALGNGCPSADLTVSPQHRILINPKPLARMEGAEEMFVSAKKLVGYKGIHYSESTEAVVYYHLLLDRHQVITANNTQTESFFLSALSLQALDNVARQELTHLFLRDQNSESPMELARPILRKQSRIQQLIDRCLKNDHDLFQSSPEEMISAIA